MKKALYIAGMLAALGSLTTTVFASAPVVPEVDGGTIGTGLGLLAGGVLLLRAHLNGRKRKAK